MKTRWMIVPAMAGLLLAVLVALGRQDAGETGLTAQPGPRSREVVPPRWQPTKRQPTRSQLRRLRIIAGPPMGETTPDYASARSPPLPDSNAAIRAISTAART